MPDRGSRLTVVRHYRRTSKRLRTQEHRSSTLAFGGVHLPAEKVHNSDCAVRMADINEIAVGANRHGGGNSAHGNSALQTAFGAVAFTVQVHHCDRLSGDAQRI